MYLNTKLLREKMPNVMMLEKEMTIDDENNEIKQIFYESVTKHDNR